MAIKNALWLRILYYLSRFGNSLDHKCPVQEAIRLSNPKLIPGFDRLARQEQTNLLNDIRDAARSLYFKGNVPDYYAPLLQNYYRSILYHLAYQRNF